MLGSVAYSLLLNSVVLGASPPNTTEVASQVDALLAAEWKKENVAPESIADDATFLRRIWLDLGGRVPPALKASAFLDDSASNKRQRLIESLLASDDFADHWGRSWAAALTKNRPFRQDGYDGRVLHEYLRDSLKQGKSYRQTVVELLSGSGLTDASGPANFLARYEAKPVLLAGAVSKQFLGVTLECAQCHDHPFAKWKQEDFWGLAAYFGRVRLMANANEDDGQGLRAVLEARRGELMVPDMAGKPDENGNYPKKAVTPKLPTADAPPVANDRRRQLAEWVTAADNPYFARHAVNQVWAQLFGAPLLKSLEPPPVDPGVRGQILELLAADFTATGYDQKRLLRILVESRFYQLASGSATEAEQAQKRRDNLARFPVRPLSVDQLYNSIVQTTGYRGDEDADPQQKMEEEEQGEPDRPVQFLGERGLSLQRTLSLLNGDYINKAVKAGATVAVAINGKKIGAEHVDWLFLATLARRPTDDEAKAMGQVLRTGRGKRGIEDVLWILVNSAEFGMNH